MFPIQVSHHGQHVSLGSDRVGFHLDAGIHLQRQIHNFIHSYVFQAASSNISVLDREDKPSFELGSR